MIGKALVLYQNRLLAYLRNPISVLGLVLIAASAWMLARSMENWAWIAFVRDTRLGRTPVGYGTQLHIERPTSQSHGTWMLVVSDSAIGRVCSEFANATDSMKSVDIYVTGDASTLRGVGCDKPSGITIAKATLLDSTQRAMFSAFRQHDFVLLDSTERVVYGSGREGDVKRVPSVLELFHVR